MFGYSPRTAAKAYSTVGLETGVYSADPHKLVLMLFEGAIVAICNAGLQMEAKKHQEMIRSIAHAICIIESGLRCSLNKDVGGELAHTLDSLYAYMIKQLMIANVKMDIGKLNEVKKLLGELKDSWEQIAPNKMNQHHQSAPQTVDATANRDDLAPRKTTFFSA